MNNKRFGQRAMCMLLAFIMVVSIVPASILDVISEEEEVTGIDIADMEVGKLYSAIWNYENYQDTYLYKEDPENPDKMDQMYGSFLKKDLPQNLTVKLMKEGDSFLYVTNEDWPATCYEYRYVEAYELIVLECLEPDDTNPDGYIEGQVGLVMDGEVVTDITIPRGEKTYVFTDLTDKVEGTPSYQWQILVDNEDNRWANILYYDAPYAALTESLLSNSRDPESGKMTIRCIVTGGESKYVSGELNVNMPPMEAESNDASVASTASYSVPKARTMSAGNMARAGDAKASDEAFQIEVSYIYWNNSPLAHDLHGEGAADTFTVTLLPSVAYDGQKNHPVIPGYKAYIRDDTQAGNDNARKYTALEDKYDETSEETHYYVEAQPIVFEHETVGRKILVYYLPEEVTYRVNHYIQNLENDEYRLLQTDIAQGYSDYPVGENHEYTTATQYADIAGFTPLFYDANTRISATGMTEVDIYYDRNYYLIDFDLTLPDGEKGYGVMPLYVRYGTQLMLADPVGPGFNFTGWSFVQVYNRIETTVDGNIKITEEKIEDNTIIDLYDNPEAMLTIKHNVDYKANWQKATASYTIAYWIENPESTNASIASNYDIWYTVNISSNTGDTTVTAADVYSQQAFINQLYNMNTIATDTNAKNEEIAAAQTDVTNTYPYITYASNLSTKNAQKVAGDGSTVVNVYFSRKVYRLKFYYAMSSGSSNDTKYYVIGGSTYRFGADGSPTATDVELLDVYMDSYQSQRGEVDKLPKLKDSIDETVFGLDYENSVIPYEESTVNGTAYRYYYLSFVAKFGSDISTKWPCDIFASVESKTPDWTVSNLATPSGWNGEYKVYYSQNKTNQTVKGKYQVLDKWLLWDTDKSSGLTADTSEKTNGVYGTVAYLCFWENGAKVGWSYPELYRYKVWLPTLNGVEYPATKVFNNFTYNATYDSNNDGKPDYYLADCYDTCDDSDPNDTKQTQPSLTGYTANGYKAVGNLYNKYTYDYLTADEKKLVSQEEYNAIYPPDSTYRDQYREAYVMNFFYTRSTHSIFYDDQNGKETFEPVPYGTSLDSDKYKKPGGPDYPSSFEQGEYIFDGWCEDKLCNNQYVFTNKSMPDKNIKLYAKWLPTYWDVVVYQEEPKGDGSDKVLKEYQDVPFGDRLTAYGGEPTRTAPVDGYIFAGWYYVDTDGTEKRFDFNTMAIKHDYIIYAKWTSEVPVPYTVKYVTTVNGQEVEIADRTTGVSLAGISKSFMAKVDKELYNGYQTGYFPESREQTFKMEEGQNTITFKYLHDDSISYRIKHIFTSANLAKYTLDGSETLELVWEETATSSSSALLTISFRGLITKEEITNKLNIMGYTDSDINSIWNEIITLSPDAYNKRLILEANTTADDNEAVFHWEGRSDKVIYEVHHMYQSFDDDNRYDEISDPQIFEVVKDSVVSFELMLIKGYEESHYKTNHPDGDQILKVFEPPVNSDGSMGNGLIVYVYYKRETYSYTVKFYDDELHTHIQGVEEISASGQYGDIIKISDVKKDIIGYDLSNGSEKIDLIFDNQEIVCYYTRRSVKYEYAIEGFGGSLNNFQEEVMFGDTPKAISLYITDGYLVKGWEYKIDDGEYAPVTDDQASVGVNGSTIQPVKPTADYLGKTIYFKVTLVPTTFTITNLGVTDSEQGIIYVITSKESGISVRVATIGNTPTTIQGMPEGQYTVSVESEWSWRYTSASADVSCMTVNGNSNLTWDLSFDGEESVNITYSDVNQSYVSANSNS